MTTPIKTLLLIVLVLGAGALGFRLSQWWWPAESRVQSGDIGPSFTALPPPGKSIPETVPEFSLPDGAGRLRSISEWKGKSLVINFWGTWCPPCLSEIPLLKRLRAERLAQNFETLGIAIDRRAAVLAYAKKENIEYPLLIGEDEAYEAAEKFGVGSLGLPFTAFTDNQGRIVTVHLGELHEPEATRILDAVNEINAGRLDLKQARARIESGIQH